MMKALKIRMFIIALRLFQSRDSKITNALLTKEQFFITDAHRFKTDKNQIFFDISGFITLLSDFIWVLDKTSLYTYFE